jgi:hypothetical protein
MDDMPERREGLKRHHYLVVFGEIADEKEDLVGCHDCLLTRD